MSSNLTASASSSCFRLSSHRPWPASVACSSAPELASAEIGLISAPGTHAVAGVTGLCLQAASSGARSCLLRVKVDSRRREFGLGSFPAVALATAQVKTRASRERIGSGLGPVIQRLSTRSAKLAASSTTITFKGCTSAFIGAEVVDGRNARCAALALRDLEGLAFPVIDGLAVHTINPDHLPAALDPIWHGKHATATKLRGHIEPVLSFAESCGLREAPNPAQWGESLATTLAAPRAVRCSGQHPSPTFVDDPDFIAQLRQMSVVAAQALKLTILTVTRRLMSEPCLGMNSIPAPPCGRYQQPRRRGKGGQAHTVPWGNRATKLIFHSHETWLEVVSQRTNLAASPHF